MSIRIETSTYATQEVRNDLQVPFEAMDSSLGFLHPSLLISDSEVRTPKIRIDRSGTSDHDPSFQPTPLSSQSWGPSAASRPVSVSVLTLPSHGLPLAGTEVVGRILSCLARQSSRGTKHKNLCTSILRTREGRAIWMSCKA